MYIARHWTLRQVRLVHRHLGRRTRQEQAERVADVNAAFSGEGARKRIEKLTEQ